MINQLNHGKIKGIIEILINPTLFFIKTLQDEESAVAASGGRGVYSSSKKETSQY